LVTSAACCETFLQKLTRISLQSDDGKSGAIAKYFIASLMFIVLVILDVFGLDEQTDKISRDYASRIISSFGPIHSVDDIVVILIEDEFLEIIGGWPPSYRDYQRLLQRIEIGTPTSITLDILFSNKLNTELSAGAERFQSFVNSPTHNTPIYLAYDSEASEIFDLYAENGSNKVAVSWRENQDYYPKYGGDGIKTPAFKIYEDSFGKVESEIEMYPIWPKFEEKSFSFLNLLNINHKAKQMKAIKTISAVSLVGPDWSKMKDSLTEIVHAKHVFIGANISGAQDVVESPIYGDIPGVYLHAVALQNLLFYKEDYFKKSFAIWGVEIDLNTLIELFTIIMSGLIFLVYLTLKDGLKPCSKKHFQYIAIAAVLNILIMFSSVCITLFLKIAPTNFLGLVILAPMIYEAIYYLFVKFFKQWERSR